MNEKKETEQVSGENVPETPQLPPKKTKESFLPEGSAKEKFFYIVKTAILIAVSAFLLAFSSYCLIAPNDFAIGGVTGIAIILEKATSGRIPQSISVFFINLPLLVLAFFVVKNSRSSLSPT